MQFDVEKSGQLDVCGSSRCGAATGAATGAGEGAELLGRALKGRRDKVVLATKFGLVSHGADGAWNLDSGPANIRTAVEGSLKRLGTAVQSEYSLFTRGIEERVLPVLREPNIGLVPFSPLGRGVLTGTVRSTDQFDENAARRRRHPHRVPGPDARTLTPPPREPARPCLE